MAGYTTPTLTVVDTREACDNDDLDLSPSAFSNFADLSVGQ